VRFWSLSREGHATSRTTQQNEGALQVVGIGCHLTTARRSLKKPCDIYAFGMTLYEVG